MFLFIVGTGCGGCSVGKEGGSGTRMQRCRSGAWHPAWLARHLAGSRAGGTCAPTGTWRPGENRKAGPGTFCEFLQASWGGCSARIAKPSRVLLRPQGGRSLRGSWVHVAAGSSAFQGLPLGRSRDPQPPHAKLPRSSSAKPKSDKYIHFCGQTTYASVTPQASECSSIPLECPPGSANLLNIHCACQHDTNPCQSLGRDFRE